MRRLLALCLLLACAPLRADEVIEFSADSMSGVTAEDADYTRLSGNARITTSDMEISADVIELSGKDFRFIKATGNVAGVNTKEQLDFTCSQMDYDRTEKIALFTGSVHLVDGQNDVAADAERIEYREATGLALMQIDVRLVRKDSVCTSAFAIYRKNEQLLEMSGNPQVVRGKDTFRAQEIAFNLDTEEITLDGRVRGTVTDSSSKTGGDDEAEKPGEDGGADSGGKDGKEADSTEAEASAGTEEADEARADGESGGGADSAGREGRQIPDGGAGDGRAA